MAIIPNESGKNIVIDTPQKQKTRKQVILLAGVLLVTAGVIYFGFFSDTGTSTIPNMTMGPAEALSEQVQADNKLFDALNKAALTSQIFKDKRFQSLILSKNLPVAAGAKGRNNPFAPF